MIKRVCLLPLVLSLCSIALAQSTSEVRPFVPGQPVEREIAGGESQTYQISLTSGQFMRLVLEQRGIDVKLALTGPDGRVLIQSDLTAIIGAREPLSYEAASAGTYHFVVRANGEGTRSGPYAMRLDLKASASAQDRQRLTAESLIAEAGRLYEQGLSADSQLSEKLEQALGASGEAEDRYLQGLTLNRKGSAYARRRQYDKAIEAYEQALTRWRGEQLRVGEAAALFYVGDAYLNLDRYEKAIVYFEQSLVIRREVKDRAGESNTLNNLGIAYRRLGRVEKAIEYHEQALALAREVKDRAGEGRALNNLGIIYLRGRVEKAIEYYEQALVISREVKDRAGEGNNLNNLGVAYRTLGRVDKAIEYYEQALAIRREVKDRAGEGNTLNNLGNVHQNLGRYEKAIEYYEQALPIYREVKDRAGEGNNLNSLANVYNRLRRYEKAIEYYEQALAIRRELKDRAGESRALVNLGAAYHGLGRVEKAIEYLEQALAIAREVKDRAAEGGALNFLGIAYGNLGRDEKAIEYYEQALPILREVKDRAGEGNALNALGAAHQNLGRYEKAIVYFEQSLAMYREVKDLANEAGPLKGLAYAERARGNLPAARTYIEESLKVSEATRAEVISPESRASFLTGVQKSYQFYTDVLMRQHQAEPTKGFDALAVETSERQRARSLLDLLAEAHADVRRGVDAALIERERSLGKLLDDKARTQATTPDQAAALKREISQLENDYEQAQAAIRKASPRYAALVQPQPLKLKEIQAQLDPDTLLLEYALGEERSYLWAITKDSLASYELPKAELIEKDARQIYDLLTARSASTRGETAAQRQLRISQAETNLLAAAGGLSRTILAPVATQLGNKRLVIVADGALQYIPFAMLPEPGIRDQVSGAGNRPPDTRAPVPATQPLIVAHEIISLPSASALAIQRAELAGRQPAPKMLAVIADPVFDRTDPRFKTAAMAASDKGQTQTTTADDARSIEHLAGNSGDKSGVTTLPMVIPRLPFTRQEANQLIAMAPKGSSFSAIDFQASRATALDPALSQYRYIHIATHGLLDTERPGLSALVFSMVDAEGKPQNGFLRANDIYNLKLPAELVVLSACQTGLGKDIKGEGLVGLTRGFMYAGAARVVVSLWNVNDKATADLMTKFYEKILKQGERPSAALRAAQVEMWKQKLWQSPYYWAAFTMQGEWR